MKELGHKQTVYSFCTNQSPQKISPHFGLKSSIKPHTLAFWLWYILFSEKCVFKMCFQGHSVLCVTLVWRKMQLSTAVAAPMQTEASVWRSSLSEKTKQGSKPAGLIPSLQKTAPGSLNLNRKDNISLGWSCRVCAHQPNKHGHHQGDRQPASCMHL